MKKIIDLGGGTAYEYIGDNDRTYEQLLRMVESHRRTSDVEEDLVPVFNQRPDLWACNPYTGERLGSKEVKIVITGQEGMQYYDVLPNGKLKEWVRDIVVKVIK